MINYSCKNKNDIAMINKSTVSELDIEKYMGTWYEIARYPHRFEKNLQAVSATYQLRKDGKITVINKGYKGSVDGELKSIRGKAKRPDNNDAGKLKVSFFLFFYSDYYVLELDTDYQWAIIGSKSDNFLWILSRTPHVNDSLYATLLSKAEKRGYNLSKVQKIQHK